MILKNDSYRGFDKKISLKINVLKEAVREEPTYDEEDIQAAKAPSLMQQMMTMDPNGDSDDEEEEEENDDKTKQKQEQPSESKKDQ